MKAQKEGRRTASFFVTFIPNQYYFVMATFPHDTGTLITLAMQSNIYLATLVDITARTAMQNLDTDEERKAFQKFIDERREENKERVISMFHDVEKSATKK